MLPTKTQAAEIQSRIDKYEKVMKAYNNEYWIHGTNRAVEILWVKLGMLSDSGHSGFEYAKSEALDDIETIKKIYGRSYKTHERVCRKMIDELNAIEKNY